MNEPIGVLQLRPGIGVASQYSPGANAENFRVDVEFSNPFHPEFSPWNFGVKFRDDGQFFQMFVFDQRGDLNQITGNRNDLNIVNTVHVPTMLTAGGASNRFTFLVVEEKAYILVDQVLIGVFDVESPGTAGEISLVTDVFNQTTVVGANTEFTNLTINSAGLIAFDSAGELQRSEPEQPAVGEFSLQTSAVYTRVTLTSPINAFSGDYSYGLLFRSAETGIDNWFVINDSKEWRHVRRSTTGAESVLGRGKAEQLKTREGDENFLEFVNTGDRNKVYLNGVFLTDVSLPASDLPFTVAPMAAFEASHQTGGVVTLYSDFAVWSVEE